MCYRLGGLLVGISCIALMVSGCEVTYPKAKLAESIVELCRDEFDIEVKAELIGKTFAIYIPLPSLLDITFGLNEDAQEMIQNSLLSASRIVLSTDADVQFYCVIAQDARLPELQVVIIKYVDDVKRAFFSDISRGEYFKRTIFDININPQSQKEQTIKDVFKKYRLDDEWQEEVLDEFFRSSPLELRDVGYWQDRFYVKDITLPEFLAEQLAYRAKMRFKENETLAQAYVVKQLDGNYLTENGVEFFSVVADIAPHEIRTVMGEITDVNEIIGAIFQEAVDCLYGYKFKDFVFVRIALSNAQQEIIVSREDLYAFRKKRISLEAILNGVSS